MDSQRSAQAVAPLVLTRGVIIHKTLMLLMLFLESLHSHVIHCPGVANKTLCFKTWTMAMLSRLV